ACTWRKISIVPCGSICPDEFDRSLFPPVAALSDVEISPQSILRYPRDHPPVSALLPVKAMTDKATLDVP
ncbi:hypothetical protein A2U01_0088639, partial [Trifolium medium]|nr:hypothetical protein [Trifolium medium]